jgi:hypothetical protein
MKTSTPRGDVSVRSVSMPISKEIYRAVWGPVRPGSQDHEQVPSLRADGLYYRDGRVEVRR